MHFFASVRPESSFETSSFTKFLWTTSLNINFPSTTSFAQNYLWHFQQKISFGECEEIPLKSLGILLLRPKLGKWILKHTPFTPNLRWSQTTQRIEQPWESSHSLVSNFRQWIGSIILNKHETWCLILLFCLLDRILCDKEHSSERCWQRVHHQDYSERTRHLPDILGRRIDQ